MAGYATIWEFEVDASSSAEFERHYGPTGSWAQLFSRSRGYIETVLLRDADTPTRYLTIDRWRSAGDYEAFRTQFKREYEQLDEQCEALTRKEVAIGRLIEIQ